MSDIFREDCHIHTKYSFDGNGTSLDDICSVALNNRLNGISFTDHCECNDNAGIPPGKPLWTLLDHNAYFKEASDLKGKFDLKISVGLELGQPLQGLEYAREVLDSNHWDFILVSDHSIRNEYDFSYIDYSERDVNDLAQRYFEELDQIISWGDFDVVAHIFYFIKYFYRQHVKFDLMNFDDIIFDLMKHIVSSGKGIEINTSCLKEYYSNTVPDLYYLKMFKRAGGEIVTIGSDSHYAATVGLGENIALDMLREAGFQYVSFYENRKPQFMRI